MLFLLSGVSVAWLLGDAIPLWRWQAKWRAVLDRNGPPLTVAELRQRELAHAGRVAIVCAVGGLLMVFVAWVRAGGVDVRLHP